MFIIMNEFNNLNNTNFLPCTRFQIHPHRSCYSQKSFLWLLELYQNHILGIEQLQISFLTTHYSQPNASNDKVSGEIILDKQIKTDLRYYFIS